MKTNNITHALQKRARRGYCPDSYLGGLFSRQNYRELLLNNLKYCQKENGLVVYAYVIMSNHVHLIVQSETEKLSDTIRDFKSFTSKRIIEITTIKT